MNRFAPALRRVARELDLPKSVRAEILLEMAADLDAAYEHHRRLGAGDGEAARRAEEAVLGSSEVVRRLSRLHHASWQGWLDGIGSRLTGGADLLLLLMGVLPMLVLAAAVAARTLTTAAGVLAWILLAVGALIAGVMALELRGRTAGLPLLLVLSAVAPVLGLLAVTLGLHGAASQLAGGLPDTALRIELLTQVARDGALLAVGLLLGIAGALSWFVLHTRAATSAIREVDAILAEGPPPVVGHEADDIVPLVRRRRA